MKKEKFEAVENMEYLVREANNIIDNINDLELNKELRKNDLAKKIYEIECNFDKFNDIEKAFKNISQFLKIKFNMSSTAVKNYRAVGKFLSNKVNNTAYKNYGFSALVEIIPLDKKDSELLDVINENTTVKEIRKMKREANNSNNESPKKAKTRKEIKSELERMLTVNDLQTLKNMIKNLKDEL